MYKSNGVGFARALVIGGSGGIGEAIVASLLQRGLDDVVVADRVEPRIKDERVTWRQIDLSIDDVSILKEDIMGVDALIITAGIGRLNNFDTFGLSEIDQTMRINAVSPIEILQLSAQKLQSAEPFFAAAITSIAGLVSSPLYALYSASKGALSRYIEAVNAELEGGGIQNRILEVAPGRIDGTGFHGGQQEGPAALMPLADEIIDAMLQHGTRYIPNSEVYDNVINRYQADREAFGVSSYRYKKEHAELETARHNTVGYLSGTFDLFHIGHLNLLRRARSQCSRLIVGVHGSGSWKGKETFISLGERKSIIGACKYVDEVIDAPDEDDEAWELVHYDRLFVGSDYQGTERFMRYEKELSARGVEIIYFPYTKGTSSTQLRAAIKRGAKN